LRILMSAMRRHYGQHGGLCSCREFSLSGMDEYPFVPASKESTSGELGCMIYGRWYYVLTRGSAVRFQDRVSFRGIVYY
jgi:hypothetical protein